MEANLGKAKTIKICVQNKKAFLEQIFDLVHQRGQNEPGLDDKTLGENKTQGSHPRETGQSLNTSDEQHNTPNFSYVSFLNTNVENKTTFIEFVSATLKWAANAADANADDLRGYLTHLSFITDKAATQKYSLQVHVDYDSAVRGQAQTHGWHAFKVDHRNIVQSFYGDDSATSAKGQPDNKQGMTPIRYNALQVIRDSTTATRVVHILKPGKTYPAASHCPNEEVYAKTAQGLSLASHHNKMKSSVVLQYKTYLPSSQNFESEGGAQSENEQIDDGCNDAPEASGKSDIFSDNKPGTGRKKAKLYTHQCSYCGKKIKGSRFALDMHERLHTGETPYTCTYCEKQYSSKRELKEHTMSHTGEKRFPCSYCNKECKTQSYLKSHEMVHTGEKPHLCSTCGKAFRQATKLKFHMRLHTAEKPHVCSYCGQAFRLRDILLNHIKKKHPGEEPPPAINFVRKRPQYQQQSQQCQHCDKKFDRPSQLKAHMMHHTNERPFVCPTCGKSFKFVYTLKYHMKVHTGDTPHVCSDCGKGFVSLSSLRIHTLIHTGEKPYVCQDCGKGFNNSANLKRHIRIHTGERPYTCSYCGKTFQQSSGLDLHVKIHTGEKPHACTECEMRFSCASYLKKHMKVHNEKVPGKYLNEIS